MKKTRSHSKKRSDHSYYNNSCTVCGDGFKKAGAAGRIYGK